MISDIDEMTKEIDSFRKNLIGINGLTEYMRLAKDEISKNTEISSQHLNKLDEYSQELIELRHKLIDYLNLSFNNYSQDLVKQSEEISAYMDTKFENSIESVDYSIQSRIDELHEHISASLVIIKSYEEKIIEKNTEQLEVQIELAKKVDEMNEKVKMKLNIICRLATAIFVVSLFSVFF